MYDPVILYYKTHIHLHNPSMCTLSPYNDIQYSKHTLYLYVVPYDKSKYIVNSLGICKSGMVVGVKQGIEIQLHKALQQI